MVGASVNSLLPQRNLILGLLLTLAAVAWAVLVWQAASMEMRMVSPTMGMAAPLFLTIWVVMMIAMMFPTATPMILTFHEVQVGKRQGSGAFAATWVFVGAYLAIWTMFGGAAYVGAAAAQTLAESAMWPIGTVARLGGGMLVMAGLYQLSPIKNLCLSECRAPRAFIMASWRDGVGGAARMGVHHGAYCLGCCWLLFVIMFPLGIMNVAAMAVITALIFAEKTLPMGQRISQVAAVALMTYGVIVIAIPEALPTFMAAGSMSMPQSPVQMPDPSPPMPGGSMPGMPGM